MKPGVDSQAEGDVRNHSQSDDGCSKVGCLVPKVSHPEPFSTAAGLCAKTSRTDERWRQERLVRIKNDQEDARRMCLKVTRKRDVASDKAFTDKA